DPRLRHPRPLPRGNGNSGRPDLAQALWEVLRCAPWYSEKERLHSPSIHDTAVPAGRNFGVGEPSLALTKNWWVTLRERDPVRFALAKAARRQWLPPLQDRLDAHKEGGTGPGSWKRLAALLEINPATLFRWRGGKS